MSQPFKPEPTPSSAIGMLVEPAAAADLPATLRGQYEFRDGPRVAEFLSEHADVLTLLGRLRERIRADFGDAPVVLEPVADPEEAVEPTLFVTVRTRRPPAEALRALQRFDREWWLNVLRRAPVPVVVTIEHV